VIDGGTDVNHEDLKDVVWTNTKEIPGNGIDDDKNGYVDDINGWSFLGGKNGDIRYEAGESARIYQRLNKKFRNMDTTKLSADETKEFEEYKKLRTNYRKDLLTWKQQLKAIKALSDLIEKVKKQNKDVFSKETLKAYHPENKIEKKIKSKLKLIFMLGVTPKELEKIANHKDMFENRIKYDTLSTDSIRQIIVGDDINNPEERFYGCNRVIGPDATHGTHVAGIIAAKRNNKIGMNGMAENVSIMVLRIVPDGDERDKDIANAIRYAADNGAKIINMSFGKYDSPDKKVVDEAVEYAMTKDVLLIHAAGNDANDEDVKQSFPSRYLLSNKIAPNWLEVGANAFKGGKNLIASFSNYGKTHVDLFAPGVEIYSTLPDNKYESYSGTSMAAPSASGVAAIIRSYFPELTAPQVKELLMKTVTPYNKKVKIPYKKSNIHDSHHSKRKAKLSEISVSGGIVNANNAVLELLKQKK
jgi:subtilisin family serine protease